MKIIKYIRTALMLFGIISLIGGMHNVDISYNMKIINSYSEASLDVSECRVTYPKLWEVDGLPSGQFLKGRDIYMLGIQLEILGVVMLTLAFII